MAFRRRLGNMAGMLLSRRLDRRADEYKSELIRKRQMEMEGINTDQQVLARLLSDPDFAERVRARRAQVAGQDTSMFIPTPTQIQRGAATDIAKTGDLSKVQTPEDIQAQYGGRVEDIDALIAQNRARGEAIKGAANPISRTGINAQGIKEETMVNPWAAMDQPALPQERTGEQEGQRQGAEALAKIQTPGLTAAEVGKANTIESGTRGEKVKTAGAESGARAGATNAAEIAKLNNPRYQQGLTNSAKSSRAGTLEAETDPAYLRTKLNQATQEAMAKAAAERNAEGAKYISDAANTISAVLPDWEKLKTLSRKVNTSATANVGTYYVGAPLQINKDAAAMDMIAKNLAKRLANDPRFGGNKGAQSEKDSEAILGRLMNSYDTKEVAMRKIKDMEDNMYKGLAAAAAMPPGASPQEKINKMRESIGLPPIDLANPAGTGSTAAPSTAKQKWQMVGGGQ